MPTVASCHCGCHEYRVLDFARDRAGGLGKYPPEPSCSAPWVEGSENRSPRRTWYGCLLANETMGYTHYFPDLTATAEAIADAQLIIEASEVTLCGRTDRASRP